MKDVERCIQENELGYQDTSECEDLSNIDTYPFEYSLNKPYPNPFNPETNIRFFLKEATDVSIEVYDLRGRLVKSLFDGKREAGLHSVVWNGVEQNGETLPSGIYFYSISTDQKIFTKKMVLSK